MLQFKIMAGMFNLLWRKAKTLRNEVLAFFPTANTPNLMQKMKLIQYAESQLPEERLQHINFDAVLCIDVQKYFCDIAQGKGNEDTDKTAQHIAEIMPHFREAGLPIYNIYYYHENCTRRDIDFHHYQPADIDTLQEKYRNSAFEGDHGKAFERLLKQKNHKNLLIVGFNASACLAETIRDAQKAGFNCTVITDAIANEKTLPQDPSETLKQLFHHYGCSFISSAQAVKGLIDKTIKVAVPRSEDLKPSHTQP